jgi:TRAP-type C4-dicarboxylate transport system substrate-binding protein
MKKSALFVCIVFDLFIAIHSFSPICIAAEPSKPKLLKLAASTAETTFFGQHVKWWIGEMERRTDGRIKIQPFFMESLVKAKDMLPAIQSGYADIGYVIAIYFPSYFPQYTLLDHQNNCYQDYRASLMASIETAEKEPNIKAELEKQKIFLLIPYMSGFTFTGGKEPIKSVTYFRGKPVRTAGAGRAQFYANLGATPVPMTGPETYEALSRGTVWATGDNGPSLIVSYKLYEVGKYWYMTNQGVPAAAGYYMNMDTFRKLPEDIQDIIIKLRREYAERFGKSLMDYEKDFMRELETKHGCKFIAASPEDRKIIFEAGEKTNEKMIKQAESDGYPAARQVVKFYRTALEKYEAEYAKKK